MVADYRAGRQGFGKAQNLFAVCLVGLIAVGGLIPPDTAISRVSITAAALRWIARLAFGWAMRGEPDNERPIQAGAKRIAISTIGARYVAQFGRASNHLNSGRCRQITV